MYKVILCNIVSKSEGVKTAQTPISGELIKETGTVHIMEYCTMQP